MRTTNKLFKNQVQAHVIECLNEEYGETVLDQLQAVVTNFTNWYSPYERRRTPNKYEAFKQYMMGLPSDLNIEFEYYKIHVTLKSWFENCGVVYKEPTVEKEVQQYLHLVTREFGVLCKKNGITF